MALSIHEKKQWTSTTAVHYCSLGSRGAISDFTKAENLGLIKGALQRFPCWRVFS